MRVNIKTSGFDLTKGLRAHTEWRLKLALDWARHDLNEVTVRLSDINGPRGGNDKRCQIQIFLPHNRDVVIEDTEADLYVAIDLAVGRASQTLERQLSKQRNFSARRTRLPPQAWGIE